MSWQDRANRGVSLLSGTNDENEQRSVSVLQHILDGSNQDFYISKDFFNVQQTAGGLPDGVTFGDFLAMVGGHVRLELDSSSFDETLSDDDFRTGILAFDDSIRRHLRFLNGVVHQGAVGEVHRDLWDVILSSRGDDTSIYACYRDFLEDA